MNLSEAYSPATDHAMSMQALLPAAAFAVALLAALTAAVLFYKRKKRRMAAAAAASAAATAAAAKSAQDGYQLPPAGAPGPDSKGHHDESNPSDIIGARGCVAHYHALHITMRCTLPALLFLPAAHLRIVGSSACCCVANYHVLCFCLPAAHLRVVDSSLRAAACLLPLSCQTE
jgi:hypothetical protein